METTLPVWLSKMLKNPIEATERLCPVDLLAAQILSGLVSRPAGPGMTKLDQVKAAYDYAEIMLFERRDRQVRGTGREVRKIVIQHGPVDNL